MSSGRGGDARFDIWFRRITGTVTFAVGTTTFVYEVTIGHSLEFAALAVGVMGVPFGKALEEVVVWITSLKPAGTRKE